ncbi:hypothetical protein CFOL_v3_03615 [Cephalotus follicularis]|uniref:WIT1/2 N-terminal helical bundle domain-containing protein n=1 Tax=Cephalotus follicularis TaxID=3775 RepID=A0A1Q3AWQ7_CEPFO|nr:hypothetical protein CFOL_v3_03615 [Cephalotus follicularis]
MDANAVNEASVSVDEFDSVNPEAGSSNADCLEGMSLSGEMTAELGRAGEVLTSLELDLACFSEKLVNLDVLTMRVATRETDFESFASEKNELSDSAENAVEFDLLSGILDSEVKELDNLMPILQMETINARELISPFEELGDTFLEMEEKLRDIEETLKQSQDQLSEMKMQSSKFQRTLLCQHGEGNWIGDQGANSSEDDHFFNLNAKIKMQTAEQQRHILRMLEKSLAKEMELEKKLAESRQIEEELKLRLLSLEQEVFCMAEDMKDVSGRLFEADNAAEVLKGISKELLGRLQILQFNLTATSQRETELISKLEVSMEQLEEKEYDLQKFNSSSAKLNDFLLAQTDSLKASLTEAEDKLILANSEAFTLREKLSSLENPVKESQFQLVNARASGEGSQEQQNTLCSDISEMENVIENLEDKKSNVESRAESAEEMALLKGGGDTCEKIDFLERQLRECDIQLQHAVASTEAGQEKQNMLHSTITDMAILIEDLKSKFLKAESRADTAEDKCIILSESIVELNDKLSFMRGRIEFLQASMLQAEEKKKAAAKDISVQTKGIANLVMRLAFERERLHRQISSLVTENKILLVKLQETNKGSSVVMRHCNSRNGKNYMSSKPDLTTAPCARETNEVNELTTDAQLEKTLENVSTSQTVAVPGENTSEIQTMRRIDAGVLGFKHIFMAMIILLISASFYLCQQQNCPF